VLALEAAWDLLGSAEGDAKRTQLEATITHFRTRLAPVLAASPGHVLRLPDQFADVPAPIVPLLSRTPHALSAFLLERGFVVRPVVPPTVPPGGERVRVCLRADMEPAVLEKLVDALAEWVAAQAEQETRAKL
jgi:8-amino-7-oxononanoate synthase